MNTIIIITVITAVVSYLIGSVNFSILISKAVSGSDIRESGSGNAGATNMLRTHGKGWALLTLILDIAKGAAAVLLTGLVMTLLTRRDMFDINAMGGGGTRLSLYGQLFGAQAYVSALFVLLGHCFPVFFGFRGGKGVATALGVVMVLDWQVGVIALVVALAIMAATRYVSLGSVIAAGLFFVLTFAKMFFYGSWNAVQLVCAALMALLIIGRHHANISRLRHGTENKLGFKKKTE